MRVSTKCIHCLYVAEKVLLTTPFHYLKSRKRCKRCNFRIRAHPRVDPSLACFFTCVQWIPQIYLWCDAYMAAESFLIYVLVHAQALVGLEPVIECATHIHTEEMSSFGELNATVIKRLQDWYLHQ